MEECCSIPSVHDILRLIRGICWRERLRMGYLSLSLNWNISVALVIFSDTKIACMKSMQSWVLIKQAFYSCCWCGHIFAVADISRFFGGAKIICDHAIQFIGKHTHGWFIMLYGRYVKLLRLFKIPISLVKSYLLSSVYPRATFHVLCWEGDDTFALPNP